MSGVTLNNVIKRYGDVQAFAFNPMARGSQQDVESAANFYTQAYSIWNPGKYGGQSMDVKEAGARAAAQVFENYGFTAYPGGRAD